MKNKNRPWVNPGNTERKTDPAAYVTPIVLFMYVQTQG